MVEALTFDRFRQSAYSSSRLMLMDCSRGVPALPSVSSNSREVAEWGGTEVLLSWRLQGTQTHTNGNLWGQYTEVGLRSCALEPTHRGQCCHIHAHTPIAWLIVLPRSRLKKERQAPLQPPHGEALKKKRHVPLQPPHSEAHNTFGSK